MSQVNVPRRFGDALLVDDLHVRIDDVPELMEVAVAATDALDAYLLSAGVSQAIRDVLEDDPGAVLRAGRTAAAGTSGLLERSALRGARTLSRSIVAARDVAGTRQPLDDAAERIDAHVTDLARTLLAREWQPDAAKLLVEILESPSVSGSAAREATLSLPSCFRSFDLRPADVERLASLVAGRLRGGAPGALVLGVRSSGSYLAPLLAVALESLGIGNATWRTTRPGRTPARSTRALISSAANLGWTLVLVDDPPGTGGALGGAARDVVALGFPQDAICLAYAVHEGGAVPAPLGSFSTAVLDWEDWDVHRLLDAPHVAQLLSSRAEVLGTLTSLTPLQLAERPFPNGHARAGYRATFETATGPLERQVVAEGTGLGYLGRHPLAIADALEGRVPEVLAFEEGVLVRRWLDESTRAALDTPERVRAAVDYVTVRHAALPARRDAAATMAGRQPAWEVASRLLAAPYREAGLAVRAVALDAAVRALLAPSRPSVIDGATGPGSWFHDGDRLEKVGFAERAFSHLDVACYDAAYDLAGLTAGSASPSLDEIAIARYEQQTGERVGDERLLLYRLVHLWDRQRLGRLAVDAAETAMARAWQDWARARLLDGPLDQGDGPWCVLDVDGVLETSRMGAPSITPAAATGLRALRAHGFRPVLATGRGFTELQDRCARYGLLGGVAEYGGVAYDHRRALVRELVDDGDRRALASLRTFLERCDDVVVAEGCVTMVRAYRVGSDGRRRGLDGATIDAARHASQGRLCAVRGLAQTDFVAFGVDKGRGVDALLELLGNPGAVPMLCVGDAESDLPMLRQALFARVPANAAPLAGRGVVATRASYQRGLAEAVDGAVRHGADPCERCSAAPELDAGAGLIAAVLEGLEGGRRTALSAMPAIVRRAREVVASTPRMRATT